MNLRHPTVALLLASAALLGASALAGAQEGPASLICEADQSYDCAPDSTCIEDDAQSIGLPPILTIDLQGHRVVGSLPDGQHLVAEFSSETQENGRLVLAGIQAGLGWSMTISRESGAMALAISGDQAGFLIFGTCVPE